MLGTGQWARQGTARQSSHASSTASNAAPRAWQLAAVAAGLEGRCLLGRGPLFLDLLLPAPQGWRPHPAGVLAAVGAAGLAQLLKCAEVAAPCRAARHATVTALQQEQSSRAIPRQQVLVGSTQIITQITGRQGASQAAGKPAGEPGGRAAPAGEHHRPPAAAAAASLRPPGRLHHPPSPACAGRRA